MKKLLVLLVVILAFPSLTAYAASSTSRRFVVRNWKAPITLDSTTPDSTDEVETEDPGKPEEPTTPAPTDEVETVETEEVGQGEPEEPEESEEHGEELLADDEPLPADEEQDIPAVKENADGQDEPDADEALGSDPSIEEIEQGTPESAAVETPADDGEEEITITTEEEPVEPEEAGEEPPTVIDIVEAGSEEEPEPEEVGEARVVIGEAEGDGAAADRAKRGKMCVVDWSGTAELEN